MLPNPEAAAAPIRARIRRAAAIAFALLGLLAFAFPADARRSYGGASGARSHHGSTYSSGARRGSHGRIARSSQAKRDFMKRTGYPNGRPGYVVDHIVPLSRGGADTPANMQWQTRGEAKAKDKWERGPSKASSRSHRRKR